LTRLQLQAKMSLSDPEKADSSRSSLHHDNTGHPGNGSGENKKDENESQGQILVTWDGRPDGTEDADCPRTFRLWKKWMIVTVLSTTGFAV
jgi:hypothetical protein